MGWLGHPQYDLNGGVVLWLPVFLSHIIIQERKRCISDSGVGHVGSPGLLCLLNYVGHSIVTFPHVRDKDCL